MLAVGLSGLNATVTPTTVSVTQTITVEGYFFNSSGGIPDALVIIDYDGHSVDTSTTDGTGHYQSSYTIPVQSSFGMDIGIEVPTSGDYLTKTIYVKGREQKTISLNPNIVSVVNNNLSFSTIFDSSLISNPSVFFNAFNQSFSANTPSHAFIVPVPTNAIAGVYQLLINLNWTNEDGTMGLSNTTLTIFISEHSSLILNCSPLNLSLKSTQTYSANCSLLSTSNIPLTISLSTTGEVSQWMAFNSSQPMLPNEQKNLSLSFSIPYAARSGNYSGNLFFTSQAGVLSYPILIYVTEPSFVIENLSSEYTIEANPYLNLTAVVRNTGDIILKNVMLNVSCPSGWLCSANGTWENISINGTGIGTVQIFLASPQSVPDKTVSITATDGIRNATTTLKLIVKAESTMLITDPYLVKVFANPDTAANAYYFLGPNNTIFISPSLDTTNALGRAQRDSSLSTWVVKLGNKSVGVGNVCDVSLIVNGIKYDMNPATAYTLGQALEGNLGDKVYEAYHFKSLGECVVNLVYGEKETITHLVATGNLPEPETPISKSDMLSFGKDIIENGLNANDSSKLLASIIILIIAGLFIFGIWYKNKKAGAGRYVDQELPIHPDRLKEFIDKPQHERRGGDSYI